MKNLFRIEPNANRIYGLDILRAVAILFVVGGHGSFLLPEKYIDLTEKFFGFDRIAIFFVLSGFLIGGILIRTLERKRGEKNMLLNFWVRRWFRTIPSYFLILIILLILNILFKEGFRFSAKIPLAYFTFSQNLFSQHPGLFPEAWSLSIEEWFYLLIPLIILAFMFLKRSVKTSIFYTAISVLIVITLFRLYRYNSLPAEVLADFKITQWDLEFRKQVITRLDGLMYGLLGAFMQFYYKDYWLKYKKTLLCLGLFLFVSVKFLINNHVYCGSLYYCVFYFSVNSFSALLLLPFLSDFRCKNEGFVYKVITKISLISYPLYLLNLSIVQYWILDKIPWETMITNYNIIIGTKYFLYWFLTVSLALILDKYFAIPMMNLRDNKKVKKWLRLN